jgi:hypothetical protein
MRKLFYHILNNPVTTEQKIFAAESKSGKHGSYKNIEPETIYLKAKYNR